MVPWMFRYCEVNARRRDYVTTESLTLDGDAIMSRPKV